MNYSDFAGPKVSQLGFGLMRLPKTPEGKIDFARGTRMLLRAFEAGVNYFDTAYMYHDGESEVFCGEALSSLPRSSYFLADKMPSWMCHSVADVQTVFQEQLRRCRTDYFDNYLIHSVTRDNVGKIEEYKVYPQLVRLREEGRIRHLGFSFHGDPALLEEMLTKYDGFEFVQLQLNYFDWEYQNAKELHRIVRAHGLPIIVMEPVRGGMLADLSSSANRIFREYGPDYSVASWAIRYAAGLDGVMTVLSGMSDEAQTEDNLRNCSLPPLTEADFRVIDRALAEFRRDTLIPCTGCRYCMECTVGIDIPKIFRLYNDLALRKFRDMKSFLNRYGDLTQAGKDCVSCCVCMTHCPQGIRSPEEMIRIQALYEEHIGK